ncbi:aminotransferase class I/II-fold pyridoxal phosphate-dependent enzyme [Nonomuraea turkmeniaca]|nr:aminotransferase class I/II-fold pyridoxal phosphate-dependent enzyme [Nonomuraea turkmeniaca]
MIDVFTRCRPHEAFEYGRRRGIVPHYRVVQERPAAGEVVIDGRTLIMAGSGDYLALAADPRVKEAACRAIGTWGLSTGGARASSGSTVLHEELEARLAAFLGRPAAMVLASGYLANLTLAALVGRDDLVFADALIHASLVDALLVSQARLRRYRHNEIEHLESLLARADQDRGAQDRGALIVTEGMFSPTGGLCDLPGIAKAASRHGVRVVMDSAHDAGVMGAHGRGAAEHYGLESAVDVQTVPFSKSFGTIGGAVAGPEEVIVHLRHHARAMVFSAALPPASAAATLAALDIITDEPERRQRVLATATEIGDELTGMGFRILHSGTPIVAVHIGDTLPCYLFWNELFNQGVFTTAMIPPSVPEGQALIRLGLTAAHTDAQAERILSAFATAGRVMHLIP